MRVLACPVRMLRIRMTGVETEKRGSTSQPRQSWGEVLMLEVN